MSRRRSESAGMSATTAAHCQRLLSIARDECRDGASLAHAAPSASLRPDLIHCGASTWSFFAPWRNVYKLALWYGDRGQEPVPLGMACFAWRGLIGRRVESGALETSIACANWSGPRGHLSVFHDGRLLGTIVTRRLPICHAADVFFGEAGSPMAVRLPFAVSTSPASDRFAGIRRGDRVISFLIMEGRSKQPQWRGGSPFGWSPGIEGNPLFPQGCPDDLKPDEALLILISALWARSVKTYYQ